MNVIVAKANEQKATAEQVLTVITAAYDAVAGKYSDGDEEKTALTEKYGEGLLKKIQDKVDGLLK